MQPKEKDDIIIFLLIKPSCYFHKICINDSNKEIN